MLLDSRLGKDPNLIEVGQSRAPPTSHRKTLNALAVFELIVPNLVTRPFVERPELDVGALSPRCS